MPVAGGVRIPLSPIAVAVHRRAGLGLQILADNSHEVNTDEWGSDSNSHWRPCKIENCDKNHQFDKNDIWVTITPKDEYMPDIRVNLLPDRPEIFLTDNSMNLGIIVLIKSMVG